ncbi:hypothetical protein LTS14_009607 [Recurvomyces mirabilis]|uniref:uncharacterized protein n=1 Tax=Recurvomyces mirabilis TaxID=574656 RepID=UPI002DDEACD2|nr:hypothetical protein LTS14_009607 [Recurvomyces mirabilis]
MEIPAQINFHQKATSPDHGIGLLVFFIPGNPGSIEYYRATLEKIFSILKAQDQGECNDLTVFGSSLVGFDNHADDGTPYIRTDHQYRQPLGLESQTAFVLKTLFAVLDFLELPHRVVLVGHSIGAYIALKLIEQARHTSSIHNNANIVGGISLFPTVPILRFPLFPTLIHYISRPLQLLPLSDLIRIVRYTTGMQLPAATTTAKFLHSPHGVQQALHLAADEMRSVTTDRWDDPFWGMSAAKDGAVATGAAVVREVLRSTEAQSSKSPGLFFYWGAEDHWVANSTRDVLIAKRGRGAVATAGEEGKPVMEIDGHGIPHAFPLKPTHSRIVAKKVAGWIIEIQAER